MIKHIGVNIKEKDSNYINRETYLSAKPEGMSGWREEHYPKQILKAGINFDANMKFFESLNQEEFDIYLKKQCKKYKLKECVDINELDGARGVYLLVLDNYKQVYIGVSDDIKRRIVSHWNRRKSLERLIFGDVCSSVLSIDSFGPLDTTRVFFKKTSSVYRVEEEIVNAFDSRYTLNRTTGGIGSVDTYTDDAITATLAVVANRRSKYLVPYIDIAALKEAVSDDGFMYYLKKYPELKGYSKK